MLGTIRLPYNPTAQGRLELESRMVGPIIDDLAKEMQGKIVFGKLNVDEPSPVP